MSLVAASLTKSYVVGLMPSAELTPVFSPMDWTDAAAAARGVATAAEMASLFICASFKIVVLKDRHTNLVPNPPPRDAPKGDPSCR
jgi:hypothetical protein